jgi:hypothetical protein
MGNRNVMKLPNLLGRIALESYRAAVRKGRFFAIDRFAYGKRASVMPVKQPGMPGVRLVPYGFSRPKAAQYGVIKALRTLNVVRTDHHVVQHALISFLSMDFREDLELFLKTRTAFSVNRGKTKSNG